jgi:hypothetical protein
MLGKDKRPLTRDLTDKGRLSPSTNFAANWLTLGCTVEWGSYKPVLVNKMETVRAGDLE